MTWLFELAGRPVGHGIRPRNLKVTTISTIMTDVDKGRARLSRLAIQGNYRAVAAQDMSNVYSRDLPHRQIPVSKFAQNAFRANKSAESIGEGASVFAGDKPPDETPLDTESQGMKPGDFALAKLKEGNNGCLTKG